MTDWHAWYAQYDDPSSSHARRLAVVRQRVTEALDGGQVRRVLSLCAGDGRDLIPVIALRPRRSQPDVVMVELDATLAERARRSAAAAGVAVSVITGDAGWVPTWRDAAPTDLLLLCGIFGNVSHDTVRAVIDVVPALVRPGGAVIWTRGFKQGPDRRPEVRRWFRDRGLDEIAFDSEPAGFGVGMNRVPLDAGPVASVPDRLFAFVD